MTILGIAELPLPVMGNDLADLKTFFGRTQWYEPVLPLPIQSDRRNAFSFEGAQGARDVMDLQG